MHPPLVAGHFRATLGIVVAFLLGTGLFAADAYPLTITTQVVVAEPLLRLTLPVTAPEGAAWELELTGARKLSIPLQPLLGDPRQQVARWPGDLTNAAGRWPALLKRIPADRMTPIPPVHRGPHLYEVDGQLHLLNAPHEILSYHMAVSQPPTGIAQHFARSGHIHPLKTPTGQVLTAEFPIDHPHQHGLFLAWVNTQFAGHPVDFWNQAAQLGTVRHKRMVGSHAGPVYAGFRSELEHVDLSGKAEQVVLHESWRVMTTAHLATAKCFVIEIESQLQAATETPLLVQKYHYGGFGWRGPTEWLHPKAGPQATGPGATAPDEAAATGCEFLTSLGDDRRSGNHTRPAWVSVTGQIGGQPATIAIWGHPSNFRHPQPVRLHPDKPYFCFAPCVLGDFEISQSTPLISRYRIVTHAGPPLPELYTQLVQAWEQPLQITWEELQQP